MLADARDAKGRVLGTNTNHKHVVGDLGLGHVTLDFRVVKDAHHLAVGVDGASFGLVESYARLLGAQNCADGLHDGAVLDGAGRA